MSEPHQSVGELVKKLVSAEVSGAARQAAGAGDIVSLAGIPNAGIADTVCGLAVEEGLPPGIIEPPTLR